MSNPEVPHNITPGTSDPSLTGPKLTPEQEAQQPYIKKIEKDVQVIVFQFNDKIGKFNDFNRRNDMLEAFRISAKVNLGESSERHVDVWMNASHEPMPTRTDINHQTGLSIILYPDEYGRRDDWTLGNIPKSAYKQVVNSDYGHLASESDLEEIVVCLEQIKDGRAEVLNQGEKSNDNEQ